MTDDYYQKHYVCPKCFHRYIETTCVGYVDIDRNKALCHNCGWIGIVDDLVEKEKRDESIQER